jgi:hypothetical protein
MNSEILYKFNLAMYKHKVTSTFSSGGTRVCVVRDSGTREK